MNLRRTLLASVMALTLLGTVGIGIAGAAPTNAPNVQIIPIQCGGQSYTIAVNGNGALTPGHILSGGSGNLVPASIEITVTDQSGNVVDHEVNSKPGQMTGLQSDLMTCTFSQTLEMDGQSYTLAGTVVAFKTPRS